MGARQTKCGSGFDGRGLQPVDTNRFFVAHLVLKADIDEIAGFDHLFGRLREPRLVTVYRRYVEKSRQEQHETARNEECDGADVTARDKLDRADQPAARIHPVLRLARLSKAGAGIGLDHRGSAYAETAIPTTG